MNKDRSLIHYVSSIPSILYYQVVTKSILLFLAYVLRLARGAVLWTGSRSAVSSGDIPFLMTSPQGWCVILLGIALLAVYMVFDIHAMIILSSRLLHQEKIRVRSILKESFLAVRKLANPFGLFLLLYVAFLLPIAGVGLGISLTDSLYIPDFITSVIESNILYNTLYTLGLIVLFIISFYYLFTFHCLLLGGKDAREAKRSAGRLMRKNWKSFLKRYLLFLFKTVLIGILIIAVMAGILTAIAVIMNPEEIFHFRVMLIFFSFLVLAAVQIYIWLFTPFQFMELTRIYESFTEEDEGEIRYPERRSLWKWLAGILIFIGILTGLSFATATVFETLFPNLGDTQIIAHRAGGSLGNENTVLGLEKAIAAGVESGEIDVQRTKDGYYVVNHDNTLKRLTGNDSSVSELTLAEIKSLSVPDNFNLRGTDTAFATYEEMLDAARDRIYLYVELKGDTADEQMVQDLYRITEEKGMLDQVTFISLSYPLISAMEQEYPEVQTGYLCFAAIGELEHLMVDELILEEEIATPENIDRIHALDKKCAVWTVNNPVSMFRFYARNMDAIITDEVSQCLSVRDVVRLQMEEPFTDGFEDLKSVVLRTMFVWWP